MTDMITGMTPEAEPAHILILGGTGEAVGLAQALLDRFGARIRVTSALAGRVSSPAPVAGGVRIGGFGGAEGLAAYLREQAVALLIDATHPFAARISLHGRLAGAIAGIPRLTLARPPWRPHPLDRWIEVDSAEEAARIVGMVGRRALLTIGEEAAAFAGIEEVRFVVRLISAPPQGLPLRHYAIVTGRGPFTLAGERHLIERNAIDVLVCKASGGRATEAKLMAAREASLPVIMIRRPPPEPGERVETPEDALDWVRERLSARETS